MKFLLNFGSFIGAERYLFAVFDGHGGHQVAEFARDTFIKELEANSNYISENYEEALKETFLKMDELMLSESGNIQLKSYIKGEDDGDSFTPYASYDSGNNLAIF